jgi:nucleoside-diphosphate-sugar epimerase
VFENDEGAGSEGLPAFSPYGLSKSFTWQVFRYCAMHVGLPLGKFVIPNPFGPYEDPRFTAYLMKTWFAGKPATVNTPSYVRDNIHVSLLAKAYVNFAHKIPPLPGIVRANPSGYPESQGAFAVRFATQMRSRLGLSCAVELLRQTQFDEPGVRINTDPAHRDSPEWDEVRAWDEIAEHYRQRLPATV